jgi:2-keto-3-deoxy-L-fuconate dehydrogenase
VSDAKFAGLRALVTGGASGIGLATARLLAARGARVACLDVAAGPVEPPLELVRADVADDAAVRAAVQEAAGRLGGIDVLVNNAGVGAVGTVEANPDAEWHRVFDINVVGAVRVTPAALPWLRASGNAAVVNTCSVAATAGLPDRALYSATKGAAGAPASGRLVAADEVAAAIAYLASPLAGATTGTVLAVDGGMQGLRLPPRPGC